MLLKLLVKNLFRRKTLSLLTICGLAVATMAFVLLQGLIATFYAGAEKMSEKRLITCHSNSLIIPLPFRYEEKIKHIDGVEYVIGMSIFTGYYQDPKNFSVDIAIHDPEKYFHYRNDLMVPPDQVASFRSKPDGCIIGRKLATAHDLKIGQTVTWTINAEAHKFLVCGIYDGAYKTSNENAFFVHWKYFDQSIAEKSYGAQGIVNWFEVWLSDPKKSESAISAIDALFKDSDLPTLTRSAKTFEQGALALVQHIVRSMQVIAFVIVGIIFLVLVNTMIMTARERTREYSVLRTLGFRTPHLIRLIAGESLLISILGVALGIAVSYYVAGIVRGLLHAHFATFSISYSSLMMCAIFAVAVGLIAAVFPVHRAATIKIAEGLRQLE